VIHYRELNHFLSSIAGDDYESLAQASAFAQTPTIVNTYSSHMQFSSIKLPSIVHYRSINHPKINSPNQIHRTPLAPLAPLAPDKPDEQLDSEKLEISVKRG
jgi:hypothetical protein